MNRFASLRDVARSAVAVAIALVAILAIVAGGALGRGGVGDGPSPSERPSAPPSESPSEAPSEAPSDDPNDGLSVDLDIATPHDVSVVIKDETDGVVGASAGRAGDGMSVRWYTAKVENVDADTVRLTWVGFPQDEEVSLRVHELDGAVAFTLVSAGPPPNSDGLGFDRVLDLDFAEPISAADILVSVQSSTDTAD